MGSHVGVPPGAPRRGLEECRAAILQAGTIRQEWGIGEGQWWHYWTRLENEQPYPAAGQEG